MNSLPEQARLSRWRDLWQRLGAHTAPEPFFAELVRFYAQSHRAYHTFAHIQDGLLHFDQTRDLAERADEVELAWWCHDAIYDPRLADNEVQSAGWAGTILSAGHVAAAVVARVQALIRATQHHTLPDQPDAALLVDIDLSILGRAPAEFDRYNAAIRQEYLWVPAATYRAARAQVLESFLARTAIYHTPWFHDRYEAQAKDNLARAIGQLRAASSI